MAKKKAKRKRKAKKVAKKSVVIPDIPEDGQPKQTEKDRKFVEKIKTVAVKTDSRAPRQKSPPTVTVCGNVLRVNPDTGKVMGESNPLKIRRRRLEMARKKKLGLSGMMDVELPQVD